MGTFDQLLVSPAHADGNRPWQAGAGLPGGWLTEQFLADYCLWYWRPALPVPSRALCFHAGLLRCRPRGMSSNGYHPSPQPAGRPFLGAFTVGVPRVLIFLARLLPVINMPMFLQHASQLNPMRHFYGDLPGAVF